MERPFSGCGMGIESMPTGFFDQCMMAALCDQMMTLAIAFAT
jgi:hypothetical protein